MTAQEGGRAMGPIRPFVLVFLLTLAALAFVPVAIAEDPTRCEGTLPPGTYDNVVVPSGASCTMSGQIVVNGNVVLEAGESPSSETRLFAGPVTINGTLFLNRFSYAEMGSGTRLGGSVSVLADEDSRLVM